MTSLGFFVFYLNNTPASSNLPRSVGDGRILLDHALAETIPRSLHFRLIVTSRAEFYDNNHMISPRNLSLTTR
jgi:hypothetical protein